MEEPAWRVLGSPAYEVPRIREEIVTGVLPFEPIAGETSGDCSRRVMVAVMRRLAEWAEVGFIAEHLTIIVAGEPSENRAIEWRAFGAWREPRAPSDPVAMSAAWEP